MAQQASPIGIGQRELLRIQLIAASRRVNITLPSIFESYATGLVCFIKRTYFSPGNRQEQICEIAPACRLEFSVGSWHRCRMDFAKDGCRLARRAANACAALLMLNSCAPRVAPGTSARPSIGGPASTANAGRQPARTPAAPLAATERKAKLQTIVPKREPTRAEQIITLVREGFFVDEVRGALLFSKIRPASPPPSGLYEDAILLARVRHALKEIQGIPDSLSATATVRDAKAVLTIDDSLTAPEAARAIDAALRTPGSTPFRR
jgi:hypothetical protein